MPQLSIFDYILLSYYKLLMLTKSPYVLFNSLFLWLLLASGTYFGVALLCVICLSSSLLVESYGNFVDLVLALNAARGLSRCVDALIGVFKLGIGSWLCLMLGIESQINGRDYLLRGYPRSE
jgi:hypothetical protein